MRFTQLRSLPAVIINCAFISAIGFPILARAQARSPQVLSGHVPAAAAAASAVGRLNPAARLKLAVGLPLRNREGLEQLIEQLYNPASPQYRQFLSVEQFTEQFGPSQEDYEAVRAFLVERGFKVTGTSANRLLINVEAAVPDI